MQCINSLIQPWYYTAERDDDLLRENKKLKEEMEAMRTEFNNEMERLEQENSLLKERLKGEESQKGILEKEIRERENEVIGVRNELTKLKGEMFKCLGEY